MAIMIEAAVSPATASVIGVWRSAAEAIRSDPDTARRQAYAQAIAPLAAEMPTFADIQQLVAYYWSGYLQARAAQVSVSIPGHMLNYQVVAAAVCAQAIEDASLAH